MRNQTIDVRRVTGGVGAEIRGIDLREALDERAQAELRLASAEHGVLFFRDQDITTDQYVRFARYFGPIEISDVTPGIPGHPEVAELRKEPEQTKNIGNAFHSDNTFRDPPLLGSMLYAREVPEFGGDTLFVSMVNAYQALSEGMRETLKGLRAVHTRQHLWKGRKTESNLINTETAEGEAVHPLVPIDRRTGRRHLFFNLSYVSRFEGWTEAESRPLLEFLERHCQRPEFACRFHWERNSIAFWDNRLTWHYAVNDYDGHRRLMHRIIIGGDRLES